MRLTVQARYTDFGLMSQGWNGRHGPLADISAFLSDVRYWHLAAVISPESVPCSRDICSPGLANVW